MDHAVPQINRLRKLWTPRKRVQDMVDDLSPQTELDSMVRDYFTRIVRKTSERGAMVVLDLEESNPGNVHWEIVTLEGRQAVQIWWTP